MSSKSSSNKSSMSVDSDYTDEEDDRYIDWAYHIFNNNYMLIEKIGKGAYCSVWLAYKFNNNNFCALKIYTREDYDRGMVEVETYNKLKTINNITHYITTFIHKEIEDNLFLCAEMQLCGYSLYNLIEIFKTNIPVSFIDNITDQIINILNNFHSKGYVHGDIKPENILLNVPTLRINKLINLIKTVKLKKNKINFTKLVKNAVDKFVYNDEKDDIYNYIFNQPQKIIICDIGTAVKPNDPKLYKKYTIYYRAPETILKLNYNHTYDYWSLGCTLYEIITGNILFDVNNDLELLYEFNSKLGPIPLEMLKKSEISTMFFNKNLSRLRGYKSIKFQSIYSKLINLINVNNFTIIQKLINIIINCLNYDNINRKIISQNII